MKTYCAKMWIPQISFRQEKTHFKTITPPFFLKQRKGNYLMSLALKQTPFHVFNDYKTNVQMSHLHKLLFYKWVEDKM